MARFLLLVYKSVTATATAVQENHFYFIIRVDRHTSLLAPLAVHKKSISSPRYRTMKLALQVWETTVQYGGPPTDIQGEVTISIILRRRKSVHILFKNLLFFFD
jgi:hypothetical protein